MIKNLIKYIENHFGTVALVLVALAIWQPKFFAPMKDYLEYFLMGALFLGCLKIKFSEFSHLKSNFGKLFLISFATITIFPIFIYLLVFYLPLPIALGLTMIAASPGAMMAPLIAGMWNLRVLWTSVYVIITTAILPIVFPYLIIFLFGAKIDFSILEMSLFLAKMVVIPCFLAFLYKKLFYNLATKTAQNSGFIGNLAIASFIAIIIAANRDFLLKNILYPQTILAIFTMIGVFALRYLAGYFIPCKELKERLTNCMMFGFMNNGIIIIVANKFFSSEVQLVALLSEIPWVFALPIFRAFLDRKNK